MLQISVLTHYILSNLLMLWDLQKKNNRESGQALPPHECLMDALEELAPISEKFNIIDKIYTHNCQLFVYYFAKKFLSSTYTII